MAAIDWSAGTYFVKTTVDGVDMGTNQLLSVPFAQYANRAANGISKTDSAKLAGIAAGAEVNVNADWNTLSGDAQILNKPTIPTYDGSETKVTGSANVTVTGTGTTTTPYIINTAANTIHTIGESYGGGIVFYVYDGGQHGLIAATADATWDGVDSWEWFNIIFCDCNNNGYVYTGAMGDGLGAGAMNTAVIVASQGLYNLIQGGSGSSIGEFAAKACTDYTKTVNGITYGGWYLPSLYELNLLYLSPAETKTSLNLSLGAEAFYWSSTEIDFTNVYIENLLNGNSDSPDWDTKDSYYFVRPIRAF